MATQIVMDDVDKAKTVRPELSCATPPTGLFLFGSLAARDHALFKIGVISPLR